MPFGSPPLAAGVQQVIINWVSASAPADSVAADSSRLGPVPLIVGH
jgi:hypothetical protein